MNVLRVKPQLLNFIYGPINSEKTTLITDMIENFTSFPSEISNKFEIPKNYVVFYTNLRENIILQRKHKSTIRNKFARNKENFKGNLRCQNNRKQQHL